jgi:hypothetical protein
MTSASWSLTSTTLRTRRRALGALWPACAALFFAQPALAAPERLGSYQKWSAYVVKDSGANHCFAYSEPTKMEGKYASRGKVSISISHRPSDKVRNEVSFTAGYTFKANTPLEVDIDGKKFKLFVDGDSAWADNAETDKQLVEAIQKGTRMVTRGVSTRGTKTTDTYSLSGSTAALDQINKTCAE